MKSFDLAAAKAGAKLVTRDGKEVRGFHHFEQKEGPYVLYALIGQDVFTFTESGQEWGNREARNDLFMAPVTRQVYVNIHRTKCPSGWCYAYQYDSRDMAIEQSLHGGCVAIAVPVTITE